MASDNEEYFPGPRDGGDPRHERLLRDLRDLPRIGAPPPFEARLRERLSRAEAPLPWYRRLIPEPGSGSFRIPALAYGSIALIAICVIGYYAFLRTDFSAVQNGPAPESDISHPVQPQSPQGPSGTGAPAPPARETQPRPGGETPAAAGKSEEPGPADESAVPAAPSPPAEKKESEDAGKARSIPGTMRKAEKPEMLRQERAPSNETKSSENAPAMMPVNKDVREFQVRGIVRETESVAAPESALARDSAAIRDSLARLDSLALPAKRLPPAPKK